MAHVIAERKELSFSEVNRIARNVPTREIARIIASNQHLQSVVVDEELDLEKKRSVYDAIHGNDGIQKLTFNGVNPFVVGQGLHRLCRMKSVEQVHFDSITVTEPVTLFQPTRNLRRLRVTGGNMGDVAAQAVDRLLRVRSCLRWVTFCSCGLSNNGIVSIGHFLQQPSNFKTIYIAEHGLELGNRATEAFARGIEMSTSIESIGFQFPQVAETERKRIFQALHANKTLKVVQGFFRSRLGREEAIEVARLLVESTTLKNLAIASNSEHIGIISDALAMNRSLQEFNCILADTNGIRCVCNALTRNDRVKCLALTCSQITRDGITPICHILSSDSSTLKGLDFHECQIEDSGCVALGRALRQNDSLEELILRGGSVTDRGARALLDGVKVHPTLKKVEISSLSNPSYQDEIDFYVERNTQGKPILDANDLPLSIWPHVLKRASDCRHVEDHIVPPNMLYFFVKEKCELFRRAPSSRKRKRTTDA